MAPQFSSFVADEDEDQLPQASETPFRSFTPDEEEKPSAARRFSDAVGQTINTALTPLPKHKPVDLPSSSEVEDAARMFEGKPSESAKQKEKPKEVHSDELKPAASHQERKEEGYGHTKVGSFIESVIGKGIDYYKEHPKIGEFLFGRDEIDGHKVVGPGFQTIPGIRRGADALANIIDPKTGESSYGRGLAAGSLQGLAGVLETGTDPRTVGTGPARPEKPFGFDEFSASPVEPQGPKQIGFGQTEEAASIRPPRRLLTAGDETPIPQDLSVRRASNLPPDLAAPGEESIFNAKRAEDVVKPIEQSLFERARAATGGKELPDELAVSRRTPEETARILGEEPATQELKTFEPSVPEEKPNFVNPFKKPDISEAEPQFQRVEGKIGPYKDVKPDKLVDLVSKGRKPSAILENLAPREMDALVARAKELGLHVTENPVVANEPIISRDADTGRRLAQSIYDGDHETTGHLLGYSPADTRKFSEAMDKFNSFEPEEEGPLMARSEKGGIKIGQNIKRAAKELTTGYSQPLEAIMVREGMQNAIDAVRHLDTGGSIHIKMEDNGFELTDSGKGMNREQLETVFSDLHESGKVSETGASGGKGVGKASYMLGGKHFTVQTVAEVPSSGVFKTNLGKKKLMLTAKGTPEDFSEHVDVDEEEVPSNTPTGTKITVQFEEGQDRWTANNMLNNIHRYSRGIKSKMSADRYGMTEEAPFHTGEGDQVIAEQKLLGNDVKIIVPNDEEKKTRGFLYVRVLNNGMYQFTSNIYLSDEVDHMPESVIADIHPTAEEGTKEYPFPTSRDNLKDDINEKLRSLIEDSLINPMRKGKQQKLEELYASMTPLSTDTHRDAFIFDPGKRMTQQELEFFQNSKVIDKFVGELDSLIEDVLKKTDNPLWEDRLERVGLVLDPGMHGVHIPNPSTGKSAILINPFIYLDIVGPEQAGINNSVTILHEIAHIGTETPFLADDLTPEEISDPRVGTYLESYLQQTIQQGGLNPGHGVAFLKRLGVVYSKTGVKRFFDAANKFKEAFSDGTESGEINPESEKLLQIYTESRGREATTEDLLSGTGDKQAVRKGGPGGIPPNDKSDGKGTLKSAIEKLLTGLEEAKGLRQEQEGMYSKERARRFAAFEGVKSTGAAGAAKSLGKLKGEYDKVGGIELGLSEKEVDSLFNAVKFAQISTPEKARAYSALFEMLEGEVVPQRNQLKVLDDVFGDGFANRVVEMHGGIGPIGFKLAKTANTMKAMRSSFDFSAPFRQGIGLVHRPEFWKAFVEMFRYYGDKKYFNDAMEEMTKDPYYLLAREAGLFLAKHNDFLQGEEAFMNSYIGNIPKMTGIPMAIDASERAYTGFLNKLRFDTFKNLIKNAKSSGSEAFTTVTDEESGKTRIAPTKVAQNLAKYINVSTGRGSLGRFEKIAPELNAAIWSPRLISSRLNILMNPKYYMDMDPFTRREAIKTLFAIAAAATTIGAISYVAGGGETSMNPLSADFLKSRRKGNAVIDPLAGFQQPIVAAARMITGSNATRSQSSGTTLENFAVNKLSPIAGLAYELAYSQRPWNMRQAPGDMSTLGIPQFGGFKDKFGQQKYANTEIIKSFVPMFIQDVTDVMKSDPSFAEQIGLNTASAFGVGIQNYPKQGAKNKIPKMNMRRLQP